MSASNTWAIASIRAGIEMSPANKHSSRSNRSISAGTARGPRVSSGEPDAGVLGLRLLLGEVDGIDTRCL
jgi:hypothetical protein